MTATGNATPKPQSAILLAVCIFVLFVAEAYWLYNWHHSNKELSVANIQPDENGNEYEAVFSNSEGSADSNPAALNLV